MGGNKSSPKIAYFKIGTTKLVVLLKINLVSAYDADFRK